MKIISNTANSLTVTNDGRTIKIIVAAATRFRIYDDDDFNDNDGPFPGDGTLDGDEGEDIPEPDTSLLTVNSDIESSNVFAPAYIRPVYDIADTQDNSFFQVNAVGNTEGELRPLFVDRDLRNTDINVKFWTVFLLGSYQPTQGRDKDPSTENGTLGIVDAITGVTSGGSDGEGSGALIFTELHRPRELPGFTSEKTNLLSIAVTVAHEVGHLFSCLHGDGGIMGSDPLTGLPESNQYSPAMIQKIRALSHP